MTLATTSTTHDTTRTASLTGVAGLVAAVAGSVGWSVWIWWRIATLGGEPIGAAALVFEIVGVFAGLAVVIGLMRARRPRPWRHVQPNDTRRYPLAIGDRVGRTRAGDLGEAVTDDRRPSEHVDDADRALLAVRVDGPRWLAFVAVLIVGLLTGHSPWPDPPGPELAALGVGMLGISLSIALLTNGRVRPGDRLRWMCASLGRASAGGAAPAGKASVVTMAAVVGLNVAIALRGISDRWTHGLPAMSDADRTVAMALALILVAAALYTMATASNRELFEAHAVDHRGRNRRHSALAAAVAVGVVGLLAGILPGSVDPADHDSVDDLVGVEHRPERELHPIVGD